MLTAIDLLVINFRGVDMEFYEDNLPRFFIVGVSQLKNLLQQCLVCVKKLNAEKMRGHKNKNCYDESEPYRQHGTVVSTTSNDFPHIICSGSKLYLFPESLYFVGTQETSKSMKTRMAVQMLNGTCIEFVANCKNVVVNYVRDQKSRQTTLPDAGPELHMIKTGVFSPEMPRRCWSDHAGLLDAASDLLTVPPNVAYEITVKCTPSFKDPEDGSFLPIPQMKFELGSIIRPINDEIAVSEAVWNLNDRVFYDKNSDSPQYNGGPQPRKVVEGAILYVLESNQLIWPNLPKYKVVMGVITRKTELPEGVAIKADMFYSPRNQFYVVYHYRIYRKRQPLQMKQVVEDFESHTEYRVDLRRSSRLGFFVCSEFNFCLVEDRSEILAKAASDSNREKFPAWIRLNNVSMVAKFSVAAVDQDHYSVNELFLSGLPRIKTDGILISNRSGFVFSPDYPLNRFLLLSCDRLSLQIGDWIHFEAVYFPDRSVYVILSLSPIRSKIPVLAIPSVDGHLFEDTLSCSNVKVAAKVYKGDLFGLVTDREDLVMDKVKKTHKNVWPKRVRVLLEENLDRSNSVAFNIVYTHPFDTKELEANAQLLRQPERKWWKTYEGASCPCERAKELATRILSSVGEQGRITGVIDKLKGLEVY